MVSNDAGLRPADGVDGDEDEGYDPAEGAQPGKDAGLGHERDNQDHEEVDACNDGLNSILSWKGILMGAYLRKASRNRYRP